MPPDSRAASFSIRKGRGMTYRVGDEIIFQHSGLLAGRVVCVRFDGCRARYEVAAVLTFDVPEVAIIGLESDVIGAAEEEGERVTGER